jgi:hypothetical protein
MLGTALLLYCPENSIITARIPQSDRDATPEHEARQFTNIAWMPRRHVSRRPGVNVLQ